MFVWSVLMCFYNVIDIYCMLLTFIGMLLASQPAASQPSSQPVIWYLLIFVCIHICWYSSLSVDLCWYLLLLISINIYYYVISQPARQPARHLIFVYACVYLLILIFVDIYLYLLIVVDTCWYFCWSLLIFVEIYWCSLVFVDFVYIYI